MNLFTDMKGYITYRFTEASYHSKRTLRGPSGLDLDHPGSCLKENLTFDLILDFPPSTWSFWFCNVWRRNIWIKYSFPIDKDRKWSAIGDDWWCLMQEYDLVLPTKIALNDTKSQLVKNDKTVIKPQTKKNQLIFMISTATIHQLAFTNLHPASWEQLTLPRNCRVSGRSNSSEWSEESSSCSARSHLVTSLFSVGIIGKQQMKRAVDTAKSCEDHAKFPQCDALLLPEAALSHQKKWPGLG